MTVAAAVGAVDAHRRQRDQQYVAQRTSLPPPDKATAPPLPRSSRLSGRLAGSKFKRKRKQTDSVPRSAASDDDLTLGTISLPLQPDAVAQITRSIMGGKHMRRRMWWIIDPRQSEFVTVWDNLIAVFLIYTALLTPVEVAFLPPPSSVGDPLFIINTVITIGFVVDMGLQFVLMYQDNRSKHGTTWVESPTLIAKNYLLSWFPLDVLCVAISSVDFLSLSGSTDASDLRILRVLRALRLIKLFRMLRASRLIKHWEIKLAVNYGKLSVIGSVVGIVVLSHWCACVWGLQTEFSDSIQETWMWGDYCYMIDVNGSGVEIVQCKSALIIYLASLYFSVMTVTSVGYGDIAATPGNGVELFIATVLMFVGSLFWATILATLVNHLSNSKTEVNEFRSTVDALNIMMERNELPKLLRCRLREYFHQTQHLRSTHRQRQLLESMSPGLQAEVSYECHKRWLHAVPFLQNLPDQFLVALSRQLVALVFAPGEKVPWGNMYVIERGLVLYSGMILGHGKVWGQDVILQSQHLRVPSLGHAMNFLELLALSRENLFSVTAYFPAVREKIRWRAIQLSFRRAVVKRAAVELHRRGADVANRDSIYAEDSGAEDSDFKPGASVSFRTHSSLEAALNRASKLTTEEVAKVAVGQLPFARQLSIAPSSNAAMLPEPEGAILEEAREDAPPPEVRHADDELSYKA